MRSWCWTLLLAAAALPFSCGTTGAGQPAALEATIAKSSAPFDPTALFPVSSSSSSAPSPVASAPQPDSPFRLVFSSPYPVPEVRAWAGGALIFSHGLIMAVKGAETLQRAAWLVGLPEIVNWDADVRIELPVGGQIDSTLPAGTVLSVHAGNRHGPDELRVWDGKAWSTRMPGGDARIAAVYKDFNRFPIARLQLPGNRELLVRPTAKGGLESLLFEPGGGPPKSAQVPTRGSDYTAWLIGPPESVRLCLPGGEVFAWRDGRWIAERGEDSGAIRGCAATGAGTLWVVDDKGGVERRVGDAWEPVPLPPNTEVSSIRAGGERLWITAGEKVLSTEPVARAVRVEEGQMPAPVYFGISGLDATGPELLNVSRDPAGPGTPACDSLVLVFGASLGAEQRALLKSDAVSSALDLFEAQGSDAGVLFVPPGQGALMKLRPSTRAKKALYLVPPSFDEGKRLMDLLRSLPHDPKPALLCAIPRNPRKLGKASLMNP